MQQGSEARRPHVSVVLVEPQYEGNIGFTARAMANFGIRDLRIVNPPPIGDEAVSRAMAGREILEKATFFTGLQEAVTGFHVVAGTSSDTGSKAHLFRRIPYTPQEFWDHFMEEGVRIALVFGREADGLRNEELNLCNAFINIPTDPGHPVMNLSHAVAVILYEMYRHVPRAARRGTEPMNDIQFNALMERTGYLLDLVGYRGGRKENTLVMLRRIFARSMITDAEFFKIMGILRHIINRIEEGEN
ncbi:rRNA methyltransferase [Thermogymnomonas acidicola]|uniref:rRNA methyltransferase n=1 Tax=Thermogymnomonas acidicola TaxID=399579 RepID=A0AA37BR59_9ARCH|nr:RNA methyltransferase [Thermogymnomonas acidicola]GGM73150.1 rRNA methyltransferase [Thermogymnomonas acidicola]